MLYRKCTLALALFSLVAAPFTVVAQQGQRPGQSGQREQQQRQPRSERPHQSQRGTASSHSSPELIYYLAAKLMLANEMEVELAQMAAQETSNADVRQFAESLVKEHSELNKQMKNQMPELASMVSLKAKGAAQQGQSSSPQQASGQQQRRQSTPDQADSSQDIQGKPLDGPARQLLKVTEQAAQNHLELIVQMFQEYQGQDLDMAFLGQQIAAHSWLLAELKAIQQAGPDELQALAQHATQMTQQHLEKAKQLAKKFEDDRRLAQRQSTQSQQQ